MAFAQEIRDFLTGYQTTSEIVGRQEDRRQRREQAEAQNEYNQALLKLRERGVNLQETEAERAEAHRNRTFGLEEKKFAANQDYNQGILGIQRGHLGVAQQRLAQDARTAAAKNNQSPAIGPDREQYERIAGAYPTPGALGDLSQYRTPTPGGAVPTGRSPQAQQAPQSPSPQQTALPTPGGTRTPPAAPGLAAPPAVASFSDTQMRSADPEASKTVIAETRKAVDAAAKAFEKELGEAPTAVGGSPRETDLIENRGQLTPEQYQEILQKVDPEGRLPDHLRNAAALTETFRYFSTRGEPQKAASVGRQILVANKRMSQTFGTLARQAMQQGDAEGAARLLMKGVNSFPDGHQVEIAPDPNGTFRYSITNNGEPVDQGVLDPEQLWAFSGQVASGKAFLDRVMTFVQEDRDRPRPMEPDQALQLYEEAAAVQMQAKQALDLQLGADRPDPAAISEAEAEFREAQAATRRARKAATQAGWEPKDLRPAADHGAQVTAQRVSPDQFPVPPRDPAERVDGQKYRDPNSGRVAIWRASGNQGRGGWELAE